MFQRLRENVNVNQCQVFWAHLCVARTVVWGDESEDLNIPCVGFSCCELLKFLVFDGRVTEPERERQASQSAV